MPRPVILIHSSGMSSRQWSRLVEAFGPDFSVVAPDLLGSGSNPLWPDDAPFDMGLDVQVLERRIDELGGRVHLAGHSYGGLLALTIARRKPSRVASLAVYDPVAFGVIHDAEDEAGLRDLERLGRSSIFNDWALGGSDPWFEAFIDYWNGPGAWRAMSEAGRQSFLRVGRKVFYEVWSLGHDRTPRSAYRVVDAPTLLLSGGASEVAARRVVELLAPAMPRAELRFIEGAGHMGPLTHARAVNEAIIAHVRKAEALAG